MCSLLYLNGCLLIALPLTKQPVVFRRNSVRAATKSMVVDRKNQTALALVDLWSGLLRNTSNSSVVPTLFAARNRTQRWSLSNLNFLLSTKETTDYWTLELFLSINFFFCNLLIFLQQHNTVLRINYLQSLNLQKALQYLQYITYSNLLTIHVTVPTIYYLQ